MLIMRNGKRQMTERLELPNKEKIRTLGDKETYKYWGILEAYIIKWAEMKKKKKKNEKRISQENEKTTRN